MRPRREGARAWLRKPASKRQSHIPQGTHVDRTLRYTHHWRRPSWADHEPHAQSARLLASCAGAKPNRRTLAKRALGRAAVSISQLVRAIPDFPFPHADPDGFATSSEIVDFITSYAAFVAAPIRCGVCVTAL